MLNRLVNCTDKYIESIEECFARECAVSINYLKLDDVSLIIIGVFFCWGLKYTTQVFVFVFIARMQLS